MPPCLRNPAEKRCQRLPEGGRRGTQGLRTAADHRGQRHRLPVPPLYTMPLEIATGSRRKTEYLGSASMAAMKSAKCGSCRFSLGHRPVLTTKSRRPATNHHRDHLPMMLSPTGQVQRSAPVCALKSREAETALRPGEPVALEQMLLHRGHRHYDFEQDIRLSSPCRIKSAPNSLIFKQ